MVNTMPRPSYPRERLGAHCVGGWVGARVALDRGYGMCVRTRKEK
jgi:hypothetical protein